MLLKENEASLTVDELIVLLENLKERGTLSGNEVVLLEDNNYIFCDLAIVELDAGDLILTPFYKKKRKGV